MSSEQRLRKQEEDLWDSLFRRDETALAHTASPFSQSPMNAHTPANAMALYRRLVRGNFRSAIRRALPVSERMLGRDALDSLIDTFLEAGPGQVRALWQVPAAFSSWCASHLPHNLPPALAELIHFESVELEILYAPDGEPAASTRPPVPHARIEADASARLLAYRFPVHRLAKNATDFPSCSASPHFLIAWRVAEKMEWQEISAALAKVLMYCGTDDTIFSGIEQLRREASVDIDVESIMRSLAVLQTQGAFIDFPPGD